MAAEDRRGSGAPALFVDIDELLRHALGNGHTTGIFRVMQELCVALERRGARFLRHVPGSLDFVEIEWRDAAAALARKQAQASTAVAAFRRASGGTTRERQVMAPPSPTRRQRLVRRYLRWLSPQVSAAVVTSLEGAKATARGLRMIPSAILASRRHPIRPAQERLARDEAQAGETVRPHDTDAPPTAVFMPRAQDVVFAPGAPWEDPAFAARITRLRRHGGRFALLIHDLIPLVRPQWSDAAYNRYFQSWFEATVVQADRVLGISRATAADIVRYSARRGLAIKPPVVVPMGTGFRDPPPPPTPSRLPEPGSYVLLVSSIETRKNHILAFRVWQILLEEMPEGTLPTLVLAGRPIQQSADFLAQLANSDWLDGHVRHIADASDAELAELYRGCRFSLYPSLYEGWGLPVTESLYFGRPCLAANLTSLPEAGGDMARYFDPDNLREAVAVIRHAIQNRDEMEALAARIASEFRASSWDDMAEAVWAACLGATAEPARLP